MRYVLEDEGWREKKVGKGLVNDSEESLQCLTYLFSTLINSASF